MKWRSLGILLALIACVRVPCGAEESLAQWQAHFDQRAVQEKILNRIFSGEIGPAASAILDKQTGIYLFPKNESWVRLGKDVVYNAYGPYLVVSCMLYRTPEKGPINATSYLFRDTTQRPTPISGGYATSESIQAVKLPKLKKTFIVMVDSSDQASPAQWSAFLLSLEANGRPRTVWSSPPAARTFRFGFSDLGGDADELVFQSEKSGEAQYDAYRWNGDRFELDEFAPENRIKALPDDVWKYGAGR